MLRRLLLLSASSAILTAACGGWGGGTSWVQQPLVAEEERSPTGTPLPGGSRSKQPSRTIGERPSPKEASVADKSAVGGTVLGTFRNTYYDFPSEPDYRGPPVSLMNAKCEPIAKVPRGFFEAVCVQGSGALAGGGTVSFAKRDCNCAEICPRTNQRICFDALDKTAFPWGRGAAGQAITPLRSVAADTQVLPMGTVFYVPELDGIARSSGEGTLDGCFVVEDRGLKVQGEHIDIFTGHPSETAALNAQVPSNRGVTIVVDTPRCAHLAKR